MSPLEFIQEKDKLRKQLNTFISKISGQRSTPTKIHEATKQLSKEQVDSLDQDPKDITAKAYQMVKDLNGILIDVDRVTLWLGRIVQECQGQKQ